MFSSYFLRFLFKMHFCLALKFVADTVWGEDGSRVLLGCEFECLVTRRLSTANSPTQSKTSFSLRKFSRSTPPKSDSSFDCESDAKSVEEPREYGEVEEDTKLEQFVSRALAHIKWMARNARQIGVKIVALLTVVLFDLVC